MFYPNDNIAFGYIIFTLFYSLCIYHLSSVKKMLCLCGSKKSHPPALSPILSLTIRAPLPVTTTAVASDEYIEDDLYADRILNPDGYKNNN